MSLAATLAQTMEAAPLAGFGFLAQQAAGGSSAMDSMTLSDIWRIWTEGGWLMIPLAFLAFLIYYEAMALVLRFAKAQLRKYPRTVWEPWLDAPEKGQGHVGEVIRFVAGENPGTEEALMRIEAIKARLIPEVNSRITVLSILVTVAPLMGLLGTVIGMLQTFRGLASASGQAVELVAEGIRVALITTQTGLMIAIPGYIFISLVARRRNQYITFLTELESIVMQRLHKKEKIA